MAKSFSPTKLEKLISYIVHSKGEDLGGIELAKIVYLIDVEKYQFKGSTVSDEVYVRAQKGPLARNFDSAIDRLKGNEVEVEITDSRGRSQWAKHSHRPGSELRFSPELDIEDKVYADRILSRVRNLNPIELERLAYDTAPMKEVLSREDKVGVEMVGVVLDFDLVETNEEFTKWKQATGQPREPDPEYDKFLAREQAEVKDLLSSIE